MYRRRKAIVHRFALLWSGSTATAADVTQDVFLHLLTHAPDYDAHRGAPAPWLVGIARNFVRRRTGVADEPPERVRAIGAAIESAQRGGRATPRDPHARWLAWPLALPRPRAPRYRRYRRCRPCPARRSRRNGASTSCASAAAHTIAAGEIGNERPIVITSERWFSPELHVVVLGRPPIRAWARRATGSRT